MNQADVNSLLNVLIPVNVDNKGDAMAAKRRFEFKDPTINANKFWEIETQKSDVVIHYGRIGGKKAMEKIHSCNSKTLAERKMERLINAKIDKGYIEVVLDNKATKAPKEVISSAKKWESFYDQDFDLNMDF